MASPFYGTETTVPTPTSYHVAVTSAEVLAYNVHVGDNLSFNDHPGTSQWGAYGPRPNYVGRKWSDGTDMLDIWVDGFSPDYSWDWESPVTGNTYDNICPMIIFWAKGGVFTDARTTYYFFVEVFNDFQAYHGCANYSVSKDGMPAKDWPGMIQVKHAIGGASQRPMERGTYEAWFDSKYGQGFSYAAPMCRLESLISTNVPPTRFRTLTDSGSGLDTREPLPESAKPPAIVLPQFNNNVAVPIRGTTNFVLNTATTGMDYTRVWAKAFSDMWVDAFTGSTGGKTSQALAQSSLTPSVPSPVVVLESPSYYGLTAQSWKSLASKVTYSGWLRSGGPKQLVGWVLNIGGPMTSGQLMTSGYGFTSLSPVATVNGQSSFLLTSTSTQEEILNQVRFASGQGAIVFLFDAEIGTYGKVTWLSQI